MSSRSAGELAGKFAKAATTIPRANVEAINQSSWMAKGIFEEGAVAAGLRKGGTLPSSRGSRWAAKYKIRSGPTWTSSLLSYRGPVQWAFFGTSRHIIVARRLTTRAGGRSRAAGLGAMAAFGGSSRGAFGTMRKGRGARALVFPGSGGPKAYAFHPGMRGRNTFPVVKNQVRAEVLRTFKPAQRRALLWAGFGS